MERIRNSNYFITEQGEVFGPKKKTALTKVTTSKGYCRIRIGALRKSFQVHRLVAEVFIPNPQNHPVVNHKDGNKQNNHVSNLEWTTHSDNQLHAYKTGLRKKYIGERSGRAVLTDEIVSKIRREYSRGSNGFFKLGQKYGVSKSNIEFIVKHKTWTHVS